MNLYVYNGPVMEFDRVIANRWSASTRAESEKKARITIPGKLIIEGDEQQSG